MIMSIVEALPILFLKISEPMCMAVKIDNNTNSVGAVKPPNLAKTRIVSIGSQSPNDHNCSNPESRTDAEISVRPRN